MAKAKAVYFEPETLQEAQRMLDEGNTKKSVCEFLGIAYNTKRLGTILENFEKEQEREKEMRKAKRRTACTQEELIAIVEDYLQGMSFKDLAENYYRSASYIKHRLHMLGALIRDSGARNNLHAPAFPDEGLNLDADFLPRVEKLFAESNRKAWETAVENAKKTPEWASAREILGAGSKLPKYQKLRLDGELVWLPGYQCIGEIIKEVPSKGDKAFRVLLLDAGMQRNVHVPYWDICSLRHLAKEGVNVQKMGSHLKNEEVTQLLNEALKAAKKAK